MKIIDVPKDAAAINELLEQAREEALVLRNADGDEFRLTFEDDDFADEIERTRQNKELMALLDERGKEQATISLEQVKRDLGLE
jgi:hypothetical protein